MSAPLTDRIDEVLHRCWERGNGIDETIAAVRRTTGARVDFARVHRAFVALSENFA